MDTGERKCPGCGKEFLMKMGSRFILGDLELWNDNKLMSDTNVDEEGKPIPNCMMCGRSKVEN